MLTISTLYYSVAALCVFAGLLGTVFPALPGLPLMLGGFILAAWTDGFHRVGSTTITILVILTLIGVAVDFFAGMLGAQKSGASKQAITGALLGSLIGVFFGLIGVILGPVIGAICGEWSAHRDHAQAGKVGLATLIGLMIGTIAKVGCAFAMLATFALALMI